MTFDKILYQHFQGMMTLDFQKHEARSTSIFISIIGRAIKCVYVVCHDSASVTLMKLRVPQVRCGLSLSWGLPHGRQSQRKGLPQGRQVLTKRVSYGWCLNGTHVM